MQTHNLGYPRIGSQRELKFACEQFWNGKINEGSLQRTAADIRKRNWRLQSEAAIDLLPSNDFSLYDQILDMSLVVGAIPKRYNSLKSRTGSSQLPLYFAMARGVQKENLDITAMEMTKWFDSNYHYIVPEFYADQTFELFDDKPVREFREALELGYLTKPVLIGPMSYLLLGKEKEKGFDKLELINRLLPVYLELIGKLVEAGAEWIQLDEPFLALDLSQKARELYLQVYQRIRQEYPGLKLLVATYFDGLRDNLALATTLPICALHIDLVRDPSQLDEILELIPPPMSLSLGLVDGRNIWLNDYKRSLTFIDRALEKIGYERVMIAPGCSLLHVPCDLQLEHDASLSVEIKQWMAFARQKLDELRDLSELARIENREGSTSYQENQKRISSRKKSALIHHAPVKSRQENLLESAFSRTSSFSTRQQIQKSRMNLPLFPTTTIGSFPQTAEIRQLRLKKRRSEISDEKYEKELEAATEEAIRLQEAIGLDVLVHGEFERNDMVEYFGQQLEGFAFTRFGWVQSYGSRCVKPPIIFGDVYRSAPMTVKWSSFAQSLTSKIVKGMLTGPVTILQWSFVRGDQPRQDTCNQIALAISDEVKDLESAGIGAIQVDEPAIREGLPLRQVDWAHYLNWAVRAFRLATSSVKDKTQIHTHMCYSEFNDIIEHIAEMDADVITIECSRSQMELLDAFGEFNYPNEIGPGVYDIHSPRVPEKEEMVALMEKAAEVIPAERLWVNPDCGLKTRKWPETVEALKAMVDAACSLREMAEKPVNQ